MQQTRASSLWDTETGICRLYDPGLPQRKIDRIVRLNSSWPQTDLGNTAKSHDIRIVVNANSLLLGTRYSFMLATICRR